MAHTEAHETSQLAIPAQRAVTRLEESAGPSTRLGWHANPRSNVRQVLGWLSVLGLLLFLIGNQQGHIEDFYLVGFAIILAILLVRDLYLRRKYPSYWL